MTQHETERNKWVERARKLYAMAEGARAIGNEAEASAFMEGLQKMITAKKLDFAELTMQDQDDVDPMTDEYHGMDATLGRKRRRCPWTERLGTAVAEAHFCERIIAFNSNGLIFVGRKSDVQVARYMFEMLVRIGKDGADAGYRKMRYEKWKANKMHEAHGYRGAFLFAYTGRMCQRLNELHKREVESDKRMSLVLVKNQADIEKYEEEHMKLKKSRSISMIIRGNEEAMKRGLGDGKKTAERVNLNQRPVTAGASPAERALARAPKQIGKGDA